MNVRQVEIRSLLFVVIVIVSACGKVSYYANDFGVSDSVSTEKNIATDVISSEKNANEDLGNQDGLQQQDIETLNDTSGTIVEPSCTSLYCVVTVTGTTAGNMTGALDVARFENPSDVEVTSEGIFVVDSANGLVKKISGGNVSVFAGDETNTGHADGTLLGARFVAPYAISYSKTDDVFYLTDIDRNNVFGSNFSSLIKLDKNDTTNNNVVTVQTDPLDEPKGIVVLSSGKVLIANTNASDILSYESVNFNTIISSTMGGFNEPSALDDDDNGFVYIADTANTKIKRYDETRGKIITIAGSSWGSRDHSTDPLLAQFASPFGLAAKKDGTVVYVADQGNHCIRKIIVGSSVETIAGVCGETSDGNVDGIGGDASFNGPRGIALSMDETWLYIADTDNHRIRKMKVE